MDGGYIICLYARMCVCKSGTAPKNVVPKIGVNEGALVSISLQVKESESSQWFTFIIIFSYLDGP